MNLDKILSITGYPGLYALKVQTRTGFVAESLLDGKKVTVGVRNNVSLLTEISIYTYTEEKPLTEVFEKIALLEQNGPAISHKEDQLVLADYFRKALPDYDEDRVYPSDIKKLINWYNLLQSKGLIAATLPTPSATKADEPAQPEAPKKTRAKKS